MGARRVVIVGGGITGLTAAYTLLTRAEARGEAIDVTLVERSARLGGSIVTEKRDGFTIDGGPDSWVAAKPAATALAKALGLGDRLVPTIEETRRVYVAHGGALHALPEGLVLAVPTKIAPVVTTPLFSWAGKARMALEPLVRRKDNDDDESIADFISRRLGREVTERLAAPMLGGIFAGDAEALSIRATFPQMVEMEQKHGSLVRGMRAQRRAVSTNGKAPSAFWSLEGGVATLVDALAKAIGEAKVLLATSARSVTRLPDGDARGRYAIDVDRGEPLFADDVVVAVPAHAASATLRGLDAGVADVLGAIPYASTATVFLAYKREDVSHPLDAVGFIVPRGLGRPLLASTWVSSKWRGRAPDGAVLLRAFFGGAWGEKTLERGDAELVALARSELGAMMGAVGEPLFARVFRFDKASAQPVLGHLGRIATIRDKLAKIPGVYVGGAGFAIGIPDCIRQGTEIATAILA